MMDCRVWSLKACTIRKTMIRNVGTDSMKVSCIATLWTYSFFFFIPLSGLLQMRQMI